MINIQKNVKLSNYSTFRIGGEAKEFVAVENEEEIIGALDYAKKNNLKFFILGGGSNVVFSDDGFDGLVIKMHTSYFIIHDSCIECGAGLLLSKAVSIAKGGELTGLEWAAGIPGTVGGAVRGNAGAFGKSMADIVNEVKNYNISESRIMNYELRSCDFSYRDSIFKKSPNLIIISAKIRLEKGNKKEIENKIKDIAKNRGEKQPKGWYGCAGSFFKNPVVENEELKHRFEKDSGARTTQNRIPAGWLIEEAGLKGKKIGNVMVSEKSGNFIINNGGGTAKEIVMLVSIIKQKIRNEFGIQLEEEVKYVI
ncbi:MAG: UDP-N-acetylmuramate dehydrogenase [bacterium]|nr:UDP-N-acetylmuramate dehydrogenase [bacterium]